MNSACINLLLWRGRWLLPPLALLGGVMFLARQPQWLTAAERLLPYLSVLLLTASGLIAYRFHRADLVQISLFWLLWLWGLLGGGVDPQLPPAPEVLAWALLVSALLLNRSLFSGMGLVQTLLLSGPLLLALVSGDSLLRQVGWLDTRLPTADLLTLLADGITARWLYGLALTGLTLRLLWRPGAANCALLAVGLLGCWQVQLDQPVAGVMAATALIGLSLLVGVIQTSYGVAYKDQLTGLKSRRALEERMARLGRKYTIAMVDVDHFKQFNDRHGHDVGDEVLRMVASRLNETRGGGKAFRYGGEEFTVLFPRRELDDALPHLESLRKRIGESRFRLRGRDRPRKRPNQPKRAKARQLSVKVSIGVAESIDRSERPADVLKRADKALYRAKRAGRNRVAC
ncbi:MAG: GGDEF domain-containing protein [Gammaproteobacteria bacterium]|nr:GGDEF domain-containing protein [Gammaproteobacteria bacterium]